MNDSKLVRRRKPGRYFFWNFDNFIERQAAALFDFVTEIRTFDVFHRNVELAVVGDSAFIDHDNVGVMDSSCRCRFVLEAPHYVGVLAAGAIQYLQCYEATTD